MKEETRRRRESEKKEEGNIAGSVLRYIVAYICFIVSCVITRCHLSV